MSKLHEDEVATHLTTRANPGSGNQWAKTTDGRNDRRKLPFAFAFDCKATMAASTTINLEMLHKLTQQAYGERPLLPIRFYTNDRLTSYEDWVVLTLDDFVEMWQKANEI